MRHAHCRATPKSRHPEANGRPHQSTYSRTQERGAARGAPFSIRQRVLLSAAESAVEIASIGCHSTGRSHLNTTGNPLPPIPRLRTIYVRTYSTGALIRKYVYTYPNTRRKSAWKIEKRQERELSAYEVSALSFKKVDPSLFLWLALAQGTFQIGRAIIYRQTLFPGTKIKRVRLL